MNRLIGILAAVLGLSGAVPAIAADLPVKAAAKPIAYPFNGTGWYVGVGSFASSTNPSIDGNTAGNLQALGASIGGVGGYRWGDANFGIALEASAFYNNVGGDTACAAGACTVGAKFTSIERVKFMMDMATLTAIFPKLGLPNMPITLPAGLTPTAQKFYIAPAVDIDDVSAAAGFPIGRAWQFSPGLTTGVEFLLPNNGVLDVWGGYFNPGDGLTIGGAQVSQGRKWLFGTNYLF